MLEREAELGALGEAIEGARYGRLVLVEGAPGIGKTTLIDAAAQLACEAGLVVLRARASQLELPSAFGLVRQLVEAGLRAVPAKERAELLAGAAALASPDVSERRQPRAEAASPDAAFAVLHGLYRLCANLAKRSPVLVAVDDLHWADAPSLRSLALLSARLDRLPLVLLTASRRGEPSADPVAYAELCAAPAAVMLAPSPLSEAAVERIVSTQLGTADQEFARACHEAVAGNPFLLGQLLAQLCRDAVPPRADNTGAVRAAGPRAVSRMMLGRLGRLPQAAARLAVAVAVLGDCAQLRHAANLAGIETSEAAAAADTLARAELFGRGEHLDFLQPIVRQAVYQDIGARARSLKHRQAARLLAGDGAAPERVAVHLLAADPVGDPWAADRLREAAAASLRRGDPGTAVRCLSRALREPPPLAARVDILRRLGLAELLAADPAGLDHLGQARELTDDPIERAHITLELVRGLTLVADFENVEALLEQSLAQTRGIDHELTLLLEAELAAALQNLPGGFARLDRLQALTADITGETPGERLALASLTTQRLGRRGVGELERLSRLALGDGRLLADQGPASPVAHVIGTLIWADAFEPADREAQQMLAVSRRTGSVSGAGLAAIMLSWIAFRRGDVRRAEEYARDAADALHEARFALAAALAARADALIERGEVDVALCEIERSGHGGTVPEIAPFAWLLAARGRLHAARGDRERGLRDLLEAGRYSVAIGLVNPAVCAWRSEAALTHLHLGQRDEALQLAQEELRLANDFGARRAIGIALRVRGLCEQGERGLGYLRSAVEVLSTADARLEHARALIDLGSTLRRSNHRAEARLTLREGLDVALRCGATAIAQHASEELKLSGARPRAIPISGVDSLTASERRVCQLAVEGLTNHQIAHALFVTLRTVETHLTAAYRKLRISSRRQLREALAGELAEPA
ncbi:MAG: AAA family ATPase [Actinomycetota bacterium]|nr:AAA family ATPase [Actinomycetota bacterium]